MFYDVEMGTFGKFWDEKLEVGVEKSKTKKVKNPAVIWDRQMIL